MRTLIFGAKGQLGRDLVTVFRLEGETCGCDLPELDITDGVRVAAYVAKAAPDVVINAAAYTDVDGAEDALEAAFLANETGARNIAEAAAYRKAPVIYFSTDYVFDGTGRVPYAPDDPPAPLSVYGRSKAAGEAATRKANPNHFIVRTAWLYGPGGNNFVEKILRAAARQPRLRVVDDQIGSPTHTLDLAHAMRVLAKTTAFGTYHAVNAGQCSRFEFAREILRYAELEVPVEPCASSEFPQKARRPPYSVLDTRKLTEVIGLAMRPWPNALVDYLQRRKSR